MSAIIEEYEKQVKGILIRILSSSIGLTGLMLGATMIWILCTSWFIAWYAEAYKNLSNAFMWAIIAHIVLFGLVVIFRKQIRNSILIKFLNNVDEENKISDTNVDTQQPFESPLKKLTLSYFKNNSEESDLFSPQAKAELIETTFELGFKIFERYQMKSNQDNQMLDYSNPKDNGNLLTQKKEKMELEKMKSTLQDLIIRLQDAEKGYLEIKNGISDATLRNWMQVYADERHKFHTELENHMKELGSEANVKTSVLGDIHRLFIDIKLNNLTNDFDSVVNEIRRGAEVLIADYNTALLNISFPKPIEDTLMRQKRAVEKEMNGLLRLKKSDAFAEI